MRMTACMTPVLSRARSSSHITKNFTVTILPAPLADPGKRVTDEHVYHAGAAELGVHYDHARRFFAYLADDLGLSTASDAPQRCQGGICTLGATTARSLP